MKKPSDRVRESSMRAHYDFSGGVRGKYADQVATSPRSVVLAPDVAKAFPTASAVNRALRAVIKSAARKPASTPTTRKSK